jgi:hypothetical protein
VFFLFLFLPALPPSPWEQKAPLARSTEHRRRGARNAQGAGRCRCRAQGTACTAGAGGEEEEDARSRAPQKEIDGPRRVLKGQGRCETNRLKTNRLKLPNGPRGCVRMWSDKRSPKFHIQRICLTDIK